MKLVNIILHEYSDEEKRRKGIPAGAKSRGGRWYSGDKYIGKVVKSRFVAVSGTGNKSEPKTPKSTSPVMPKVSKGRDVPAPRRSSDDTSSDVQVVI